jgi:hypothetical protein
VSIDGLSVRDPSRGPESRVVLATLRLRSALPQYLRWNSAFLVLEAVGGPVAGSWGLTGPAFEAVPGQELKFPVESPSAV